MTLKNYLLLFTAGIAISASANARNPRQTVLPKPPGMSDRVYSIVNAKFRSYDGAIRNSGNTAAKTAAGAQRVIGGAYYEWGGASPMLIDSLTVKYGGQRSSRFSDYSLQFDFANEADQPGDALYQDSYVHYDTADVINYSSGAAVRSWRAYNAADQVTQTLGLQGERKVFSYLPDSRISKVITMNDGGSGLDSTQRDFYLYNASGMIFRDSVEIYDSSSMSWMHSTMFQFTKNASGQVTSSDIFINFMGAMLPFLHQEYTYAPNGKVRLVTMDMLDFNTQSLVPYSKDSFGYTGNAMVYHDFTAADQATGVFALAYTDRRRLNAQGLPDSVSQISLDGGDDGYYKLVYDANNYPTRVTYWQTGGATPDYETRYYYQLAPISVPKLTGTKPLALAPNPALNQIRLDNKLGARFRVIDLNGKLMMEGSVGAFGSIGVEALMPGMYSVILSDASGETFSGRFVKQ